MGRPSFDIPNGITIAGIPSRLKTVTGCIIFNKSYELAVRTHGWRIRA